MPQTPGPSLHVTAQNVRAIAAALIVALSALTIVGASHRPAAAAPALDVSVNAPATTLIGTPVSIEISVNNGTSTPGYNTGIAVVLPAGVSFGSSASGTQILTNTPGVGQTTVWFENINDSQPNSSETLTLSVSANTGTYPVGASFDVTATAYTSDDPRVVPTSNGTGSTGTGTDTDTIDVTAITIDKSEPSPEAELMRGVHDNTTVYTLEIENNPTNATNSVVVDDYLPAGLEFLACGTIDNTTDAPTFAGNNVEYAGAPRLDAMADVATDCPAATLVETVSIDPDGSGPLPLAVYTHVQWTLGNFAPGATQTINYAAGIPIRENTLTWSGATPATTGAQAANLDNNDGAETADEQLLRNHSIVQGAYQGPLASGASNPVGDTDDVEVTAEDVRLLKSVNPTNVTQGTDTLWTITISTSEYRTLDNLDVTDTLPDGHCPLGPINYDASDSGGECDPSGTNPSTPYTSVVENADGTWTIFWDDLAVMGASETIVLTFPSRVRVYYQEGSADQTPVVTNDGFVNNVSLTADDHLIAGIPADEPSGTTDVDASSASQTASQPTLEKTVSVPTAPGVALDCNTATYIDADTLGAAPFAYRPGDIVCYTLRVDVPANLTFRNALVSDFLPAGVTFLSDLGPTANNDITDFTGPVDFTDGGAVAVGDQTIAWDIGTTVTAGARYLPTSNVARTWEVRITAEFTGAPTGDGSSLEKANLMKLTTQNSSGAAISLRDQATFIAVEPELTIAKNTPATVVVGGDTAAYTVTVSNVADVGSNAGYAQARDVDVTDDLPAPFTCSDITLDTIAGVTGNCVGSQITWTINSLDAGASIGLTYTLTVPNQVAPSQTYTNTATLVDFEQLNNDSGTTAYTPGTTATDTITTPAVVMDKLLFSSVAEAGNISNGTLATSSDEATIGETVSYRITLDIPEGVTVFDGQFDDALPSGLTLVGGSVTATYDDDISGGAAAAAIPTAGFTFDGSDPTQVNFPATLTNADGSGVARVVIDFDVTVDDIVSNAAGTVRNNRGRFVYRPTAAGAQTTRFSSNRGTRIVEPNPQIDKSDNVGGVVGPGQTVTYTLAVTNPTAGAPSPGDVSVVHDMTVVDVIPARIEPVLPIPDNGVWAAGPRTITWTSATTPALASLDPNAAAINLTYQAATQNPIPIGGTIDNTATVTGSSMAGSVTGERSYNDNDLNSLATSQVAFTKVLNPDAGPYTIGESIAYQLTATVPQDTVAYDTTVTDVVPDGLVFDSAVITPGANCSITGDTNITLTTTNADGSTLVAFFLGDTQAIGGNCVFTIDTVAHVGSAYSGSGSPAAGVAVSSGDSLTNTARSNWMQSDTVTSTPTSTGDLPSSWNGQSVTDSETVNVTEPLLVLDKDVETVAGCDLTHVADAPADDDDCLIDPAHPTLTYTITVTNTGDEPAHDIVVTDQPDAELVAVTPVAGAAAITDGWTAGDPDMQWETVGPLAPGNSLTFSYTADLVGSALLTSATTIANTADVPTYFGLPAATRATSPNERTYGSTFGPVAADTVTLTPDFPALAIDKQVIGGGESDEAFVGTDFGWSITITNTATVGGALDVDLHDTLPLNWDYVAGSAQLCTPGCVVLPDPAQTGATSTGLELDWTDIVDLAATASAEVRFNAVPLAAALTNPGSGGTINHTNTSSATGDDNTGAAGNGDGPYATGDDTASGIIYEADVRIDKEILTPDPSPYLAGQTVVYRVTATNDGPDAATNVIVDEVLDGGALIYVATDSVDGAYNSGTGEWTLPTPLANGASAVLELRVIIDHPGVITNTAQVTAADRYDPDSTPDNDIDAEDDQDSVTITVGTASLGTTVWFDVDGSADDETLKGTEPGFNGVTLTLLSQGNDNTFGTPDDYFGPDGVSGGVDDITVITVTTDASGFYGFTDLPDGTYRVQVDPSTLPDGATAWAQTFDDNATMDHTSGDIVLTASGASYLDADFSYTGTASLGDEVFWDVDRSNDGILAGQDQPIANIDVDLTWAGFDGILGNGDDIAYPTDVTDGAGVYGFTALPPGLFAVTVDVADTDFPTGLVDQTWDVEHTAPGGGDGEPAATASVTLAAAANRTDVDFSFAGTASLGDTLWLDLDGDGIEDAGEPGIPGVTITAVWLGGDGVPGGGDDLTLTTVTAADGTYLFSNLPAGQFDVTVDTSDPDFPTGVTQTFDLDGLLSADTAQASLTTGQNRDDVDFGYVGTASIGDLVWLDLDADGTVNGPEVGLAGVDVIVTWVGADNTFGTADDVTSTVTTDANGIYGVTGLPFGQVRVTVVDTTLAPGLSATYDLDATLDHTTTVTLDGTTPDRLDVDFGYRGSASIGDTVWVDTDGDFVLDASETGLDGVGLTVNHAGLDGVLGTGDDIIVPVTTAGGGVYGVDFLPGGTVSVSIVSGVPADHVNISELDSTATVAADGFWTGTLGATETKLDVDFGVRPDADLSITKSHVDDFVIGQTETYTVVVANAGPAIALGTTVADSLPIGLTFVSASGVTCTASGQDVTCDVGDLAVGETATISMTVAVAAAAAPLVVNTATVTSDTPDRDPSNNTDSDPTRVPLAQIILTKTLVDTLTAGEQATYGFTVRNDGPSAAESVTVVDPLPAGLTFVSASGSGWTCTSVAPTVTCSLSGDLPVNSTTSFQLVVAVSNSASGTITNLATAATSTPEILLPDDISSVSGFVQTREPLAFTGAATGTLVGLGLAMVLGGSYALALRRRRLAVIKVE